MFPDALRDAAFFVPAFAAEMGANFARTCVGGGMAALLVGVTCRSRWGRRLSARVRFALWWLVCVKFATGVFCAGIVPLVVPVSPPVVPLPLAPVARSVSAAASAAVRPLLRRAVPAVPRPEAASAWAAPAQAANAAFASPTTGDSEAAGVENAASKTPAPAFQAPPIPPLDSENEDTFVLPSPLVWAEAFFTLVYFCGLLVHVWRMVRAAHLARRVVQNAREISDAATRDAAEAIAHAVWDRVGKTPRLRESAWAASPFVAGLLRPVLVLPEGFAQTVSAGQLRLALAHEMAHLRRGDLWLQLIPQLTQILLWFFPLALLACRECAEAGEEACDADALAACPHAAGRGDLGRLLLQFGQKQPKQTLSPALGMAAAPGFARLKRRLHALQPAAPTTRLGKAGAVLLALVCGTSVLPWRISAAPAAGAATAAEPTNTSPNEAAAFDLTTPPRYEIVDLGVPGETYSDACAISDTGVVVGTRSAAETGGRGVAFAFNAQTGQTEAVGAAPYRRSVAVGVSASGTVAGLGYNRRNKPQAFVWNGHQAASLTSANAARTFLWPLPGFRYSRASGINDQNQVVGSVHGLPRNGVLPARAFLYTNNTVSDLGTLGGPYSHASAINGSGLVVGKADVMRPNRRGETGETHAFALQTGPDGGISEPMRDLGTLPGGKNSRAWSVNAQNEIVGYSQSDNGTQHAFLQAKGGTEPMCDLGTLPGKQNSVAYAISDRGWIVGASSSGPTTETQAVAASATLWLRRSKSEAAAQPVDLNTRIPQNSGWTLQTARGINQQGWIVGQGVVNNKQRAFLLKPVK